MTNTNSIVEAKTWFNNRHIEYRPFENLVDAFKTVWMEVHTVLYDLKNNIDDYYIDYKNIEFYVNDTESNTYLWRIYPAEEIMDSKYIGNRYEVYIDDDAWWNGDFWSRYFDWEGWNKSISLQKKEAL